MSNATYPLQIEAAARALARVMSNGGDPDAPAIRWNGTEMEPQEFPAWHDWRDEAVIVVAAIRAASSEVADRNEIARERDEHFARAERMEQKYFDDMSKLQGERDELRAALEYLADEAKYDQTVTRYARAALLAGRAAAGLHSRRAEPPLHLETRELERCRPTTLPRVTASTPITPPAHDAECRPCATLGSTPSAMGTSRSSFATGCCTSSTLALGARIPRELEERHRGL